MMLLIGADFSLFYVCGFGVGWNGNIWMAVGEDSSNTIKYSSDAVTLTGLGKTVFSTRGMSVTWSGSMWIAGGSGTNRAAYSYDGLKWIPLGNSIFTAQVEAIGWNSPRTVVPLAKNNSISAATWSGIGTSLFITGSTKSIWKGNSSIALGSGTNSIAYNTNISSDIWTGLGSSILQAANSICWNNNRSNNYIDIARYDIIALGEGNNSISWSNNGINFTGLGTTMFTSGYTACVYKNEWLAGGTGNNSLIYSKDGRKWEPVTDSNSIFTSVFQIIRSKNDKYIAVGEGNFTMAFSYDGRSFIVNNNSPMTSINGIAENFNNGDIVIAGVSVDGNNVSFSSNGGVSWIGNNSFFDTKGNKVLFDGNKWLVAGEGTTASIIYTFDGLSWENATDAKTIFTNSARDIDHNTILHVAVGDGTSHSIASSSNRGISWTGRGKTLFNVGYAVKWNRNLWVACGGGGASSLAYSLSGVVWIPCVNSLNVFTTSFAVLSNYENNVSYSLKQQPIIILGGDITHTVAVSYNNGLTYTGKGTSIFSSNGLKGAFNGEVYVLVGNGTNSIASSYDTENWTAFGTTIFISGNDVCYHKNKFVAVGESVSGKSFVYSYDGMYWRFSDSNIFDYGLSISSNDNALVSCGIGPYDCVAVSFNDAETWTGIGYTLFDSAFGVANDGRNWVIVGQGSENTMAISPDAINWAGLGTTLFSNYGSNVSWNGSMFIAVGSGSTIMASSLTGSIWTSITTSLSYANDITWSNSFWIVSGSSILYSYDSIVWTNVIGTSIFSSSNNSAVTVYKNPYLYPSSITVNNLDLSSSTFSNGYSNFVVNI
jgi:hypothetical protein